MRKDFLFWGAKIERWLMRTVVLFAVMLVAAQWFAKDPVMQAVNSAGLETRESTPSSSGELDHLITFQLLEYSTLPMAEIIVNGQKAADFKERFVTVPVADGDVLEIDAKYYRRTVSFKILDTYGGVKWPKVDDIFKVEGTVKNLGTVVIEEKGKD